VSRRNVLALSLLAVCAGCMTVQTYDGPRRESDEVARISGDLPVTAGAPVSVILRQVDGRELKLGQIAVELLPGEHELLVDCRIAETSSITRHALDVDVSAGRQYRLVAQVEPGLRACSSVAVEPVN
jgi:hypothetical protein